MNQNTNDAQAYTVYALVSSRNPDVVKYIGLTRRPLMRIAEHIEDGNLAINKHRIHQLHMAKQDWIASEIQEGHQITMVPLVHCSSLARATLEEAIMCGIFTRMGYALTNHPSTEAQQMFRQEHELIAVIHDLKRTWTQICDSFTWLKTPNPYMDLYKNTLLT